MVRKSYTSYGIIAFLLFLFVYDYFHFCRLYSLAVYCAIAPGIRHQSYGPLYRSSTFEAYEKSSGPERIGDGLVLQRKNNVHRIRRRFVKESVSPISRGAYRVLHTFRRLLQIPDGQASLVGLDRRSLGR